MIYNTIGPILQNGESQEEALDFLHGFDFSEDEVDPQEIKYADYIDSYQGIDMYYDYGADYYFFAISDDNALGESKTYPKEIVRLTESDLHAIITETVRKVLQEEEGAATNGAGFFNGTNNSNTSAAASFAVPFGNVQRRNGKGGSISIPKKRA